MTVTPQGDLYLCKTKLENDYKNQFTWNNINTQTSYFNGTVQNTFSDYTYMKKDGTVTVSANIDAIIGCNYLFYVNTGFTTKRYYCFITNMQYVNENTTRITFETDCFQTWYFELQYNRCFIEREHVNDDTIGLHSVPEGLETGEYVIQGFENIDYINYYDSIDEKNQPPLVVMAISELGISITHPEGVERYNGVFSGLEYICFKTMSDARQYVMYSQQQYNADNIYSIFMAPYNLCVNQDTDFNTYTIGSHTITMAFVKYTDRYVTLKDTSILKPTVIDKNYQPKNNKLFTFPYRYMTISNNAGSNANYYYEYFKSTGNDIFCNFYIQGAIDVGCSIQLTPIHYKDSNYDPSTTNYDYLESIDAYKLPTCCWTNDPYTNWLTQNAINIPLDITKDIISLGVGATTGNVGASANGLFGITNTLGEFYERQFIPATAKSGANQGDLNYARGIGFTVYKKSIKEEFAKIIDNYFSMFGYKVNTVKIPNITGRRNWNYVKTIDCNFDGDIPQTDLNIIKAMFNNGVTLWHNPANIYNYSLDNSII